MFNNGLIALVFLSILRILSSAFAQVSNSVILSTKLFIFYFRVVLYLLSKKQ